MKSFSVGLQALPLLQQSLSIERAKMRLKLQVPLVYASELQSNLEQLEAEIEAKDANPERRSFICLIDPGKYRQMHSLIQDITKGEGQMELLNLAAQKEGTTATSSTTCQPSVSSVVDNR